MHLKKGRLGRSTAQERFSPYEVRQGRDHRIGGAACGAHGESRPEDIQEVYHDEQKG